MPSLCSEGSFSDFGLVAFLRPLFLECFAAGESVSDESGRMAGNMAGTSLYIGVTLMSLSVSLLSLLLFLGVTLLSLFGFELVSLMSLTNPTSGRTEFRETSIHFFLISSALLR